MYLKDSNQNLIKQIPTSFELSYQSICDNNVDLNILLNLRNKKDKGWIKFYYLDYVNSYSPDLDDTALFYIALIKKNKKKFMSQALKIIDSCKFLRTPSGLMPTWPKRNPLSKEQQDFVVNLHYLWLCHLVGIREEEIEKALLKWLKLESLTTLYYHNEIFIIFSCIKASQDFIDGKFKKKFIFLIKKKINNNKIVVPTQFKDLNFHNGIFRHIEKEVYFHLFKEAPKSEIKNITNLVDKLEIEEYYKNKQISLKLSNSKH